jgi:hypothetical protein
MSLDPRKVENKFSSAFVYTEIVYGPHPDNRSSLTTFFKPLKYLEL